MDGIYGFKNLIPILKNQDLASSLYGARTQVELEKFLKKNNIILSIEEIEKLWDIIEVCRPSGMDTKQNEKSETKIDTPKKNHIIKDNELDIAGGTQVFCDKLLKMASLLEH